MLQGKIAAALRWITIHNSKVLSTTFELISILEGKHPNTTPISIERLISVEIPKVQLVMHYNIHGNTIYKSAKLTNCSAGPCGLDSDAWRRTLCSKSFNMAYSNACDSLSRLTSRLCVEYYSISS